MSSNPGTANNDDFERYLRLQLTETTAAEEAFLSSDTARSLPPEIRDKMLADVAASRALIDTNLKYPKPPRTEGASAMHIIGTIDQVRLREIIDEIAEIKQLIAALEQIITELEASDTEVDRMQLSEHRRVLNLYYTLLREKDNEIRELVEGKNTSGGDTTLGTSVSDKSSSSSALGTTGTGTGTGTASTPTDPSGSAPSAAPDLSKTAALDSLKTAEATTDEERALQEGIIRLEQEASYVMTSLEDLLAFDYKDQQEISQDYRPGVEAILEGMISTAESDKTSQIATLAAEKLKAWKATMDDFLECVEVGPHRLKLFADQERLLKLLKSDHWPLAGVKRRQDDIVKGGVDRSAPEAQQIREEHYLLHKAILATKTPANENSPLMNHELVLDRIYTEIFGNLNDTYKKVTKSKLSPNMISLRHSELKITAIALVSYIKKLFGGNPKEALQKDADGKQASKRLEIYDLLEVNLSTAILNADRDAEKAGQA